MLKYKDAGGGIADVDKKKNIVVGYASHFDNKDSHNDIVLKGAFKRTVDHNGSRVKALMHHDPVMLVGKPVEMGEDQKGLLTETRVSRTAAGEDLLTLIEDEVLDEMSIGYIPVKEGYDEDAGANLIHEVKLVEYSFVTLASNPAARIQGLKGTAAVDKVIESMKRMEKALRDGVFVTDEVPEHLEFALKYWRTQLEFTGGVVENGDVVSSGEPKSDPSSDTRSDPADATRVIGFLDEWRKEQELLHQIRTLGASLER